MKVWMEFLKSIEITTMFLCFLAGCVAINFNHDAGYVFFFVGVLSGCIAFLAEKLMEVSR